MWYRLVGVDLSQGNLTADAETSVRFVLGQLHVELAFGTFEQVAASNNSVASSALYCRPLRIYCLQHRLQRKPCVLDISPIASHKGIISYMGNVNAGIPHPVFSYKLLIARLCTAVAQMLAGGSCCRRKRRLQPSQPLTDSTCTKRWM